MEKIRIRDPGMEKFGSGIRDKHPGSVTLLMSSLVADLDGQARRKGSEREVREYAPHACQGGSGQISLFFFYSRRDVKR
jgi:hypothetical protein